MKIGDKVRFLSEVGGGVVTGFQGKDMVLVEDADGFDIPMPIKECVVIDTDDYNMKRKPVAPAPKQEVAGAKAKGASVKVRPDEEEDERPKVAIIGKPNAGKSSLLNAILKEDRAIVTEYEGTTRDTIEEFVNINGIPLKLIDTAGIRETENAVEKIGIEKSIKYAKEADLAIVIIDGSKDLSKEDIEILDIVNPKKTIIILNKIDLKQMINENTTEISRFNNIYKWG